MTLDLERSAVVELARSLGGSDFELRELCQGGEWLFLLLSFRSPESRLHCAVVAAGRDTLEVGATQVLGYIKHDNGGGTLHCTASGSRVSVGTEFTVHVLEHREGSFAASHAVDTEQSTEDGWFWGEDHLLHLDEMSAGGLVLTDLRDGHASVLELEAVDRYGVSPAAAFGATLAAGELIVVALPELTVLGRHPVGGSRDELLFHPTRPELFTIREDAMVRVDVAADGTRVTELRSVPTGRLEAFDLAGRKAFARTDHYRLPSTPLTVELWDADEDRLSVLPLPVDGRDWWVLPDDALAVAHRGPEPPGGVRLSFARLRD